MLSLFRRVSAHPAVLLVRVLPIGRVLLGGRGLEEGGTATWGGVVWGLRGGGVLLVLTRRAVPGPVESAGRRSALWLLVSRARVGERSTPEAPDGWVVGIAGRRPLSTPGTSARQDLFGSASTLCVGCLNAWARV